MIPDPRTVLPFEENNPAPKKNLRAEAERFIRERPDIYAMFEHFAREMFAKGRPFGAKLLAERVRWECALRGEDDYKLNNNYVAYIARQLIADHPAFEKYIRCRKTFW